jgi:hypothetical protein
MERRASRRLKRGLGSEGKARFSAIGRRTAMAMAIYGYP